MSLLKNNKDVRKKFENNNITIEVETAKTVAPSNFKIIEADLCQKGDKLVYGNQSAFDRVLAREKEISGELTA